MKRRQFLHGVAFALALSVVLTLLVTSGGTARVSARESAAVMDGEMHALVSELDSWRGSSGVASTTMNPVTATGAMTPTYVPVPTAPPGARLTVGSKNFTEEFVIAELYAQMLEDAGFKINRKLNLGGTPVLQAALLSGEIDLYPEYTGTALLTVLKLPVDSDPERVHRTVADAYKEQFNLIWLDQAAMNDTQALAMTAEKAQQLDIKTISDLVAKANQLTLIGPPEFEEREDGLPGLRARYGNFQLKRFIPVDPGLRYQGLLSGQADVVVAFSTDWQIVANRLVLLKDDKGLWPPYHVAPVVRAQVLASYPQIGEILNRLAPRLTTEAMQTLNLEAGSKQRAPAEVAREFLRQQGLIKPQ